MVVPPAIPTTARERAEAIAFTLERTFYAADDGTVTSVEPHGKAYTICAGWKKPDAIPADIMLAGAAFAKHGTFVAAAHALLEAGDHEPARLLLRIAAEQERDAYRRKCMGAAR